MLYEVEAGLAFSMNFSSSLFLVPVICGPIYIAAGFLLYKYPPENINSWYGYRTPSSKRSQKRWNFAQKRGAVEIMKSGFYLMVIAAVSLLFNLQFGLEFICTLAVLILFSLVPVILTERKIKEKFGKD